jgi:parallel beta-helix repeat protein
VRNSTILAPGAGVDVIGDSTASIGHNVIANHFGDSEHSDAAVMVRGGSATITSNDVSGYFFGVLIPAGQAAVLSNTIHDNLTGVEVGNFSGAGGAGTATVVNNDIHHNALFGGGRGGVEVSSDGSIVSANRVHDNAGHGISVTPTASGNQILANVATNNDGLDSSTGNATAGTANTWLNNIGPSSFPPGICLPPGP